MSSLTRPGALERDGELDRQRGLRGRAPERPRHEPHDAPPAHPVADVVQHERPEGVGSSGQPHLAPVALIGGWFLGGVLLRAAGCLIHLLGALALVLGNGAVAGLVSLAVGALLWLAAHWLFALRHHVYASPLAQRIFVQLLPRALDPTRKWSVPVHDARPPTDPRRSS
jgi:hypothetical protein